MFELREGEIKFILSLKNAVEMAYNIIACIA